MPEPLLTRAEPSGPARGVVLMLHGGAEHNLAHVGRSRAWVRSRAMMGMLQRDLHGEDLAVWLLRYRVRGWNDGHEAEPSPVPDARWALAEAAKTHPELPVVIVGHSMGGRTAVNVAGEPNVAGVVALAPWFTADDPVEQLAGRRLYAAHGRRDRITRYKDTAAYIGRAASVAEEATLTDMGEVGHYLLKSMGRWNRFVREHTLAAFG